MEHKDQHFIPQTYLRAWCDPETPQGHEPYVWQFTKDGASGRRRAPKKIFFQKDLYTIRAPDGGRDLRLEKGFSELEGRFTEVRSKLLDRQTLDAEDHLVLVTFVAALHARVPAQIGHTRGQWAKVLDMMQSMKSAIDAEPKKAHRFSGIPGRGPSLGIEEVQQLVENTVEHTVGPEIKALVPILLGMNVALLVTDDEVGFITSDAPVVVFDPEAHLRPWQYRSPGLGWPKVEVTCPISPGHLLLFNRQGLTAGLPVPPAFLDELNRRTRFHAHEHYVTRRNVRRDIWFATIELPQPRHGPAGAKPGSR